MAKSNDELEKYIKALEEELGASIEREKVLLEKDLSFGGFLAQRVKRTKVYKNILSDPDSKMGAIARAPRSFYRLIKNPEVRKSIMQKKTVGEGDLAVIKDDGFLEPWKIDLEVRRDTANKALHDGRKVALYFVEKPDSSTFRYRCYNTYKATLDSKKWQSVYFFKDEIGEVEELLPKSDVLIFGRQSGQEKNVASLIKIARKNNIKVGLDIDDLVFDMKYFDTVVDTIGENVNRSYWRAYFASVQSMAKQMDFFLTTNKFLSDRLKESFGKPCKEIRNSLNDEQVAASLVYASRKDNREEDKFIIGYFSGSPTHKKDLDEALPEVIEFLDKHEEAVLNIVGYMKFSTETQRYVDKGRIRFLPMVDFRKLQRMMAEVDVNIAPLVINDFTNCKSELKFFEAAIVDTTTIASPTYTFKKAIEDGKNGFLANPGEWYDKLEYLYKHPEENRKIAKCAHDYALKHYYGKEFLKEVEAAYDSFAK